MAEKTQASTHTSSTQKAKAPKPAAQTPGAAAPVSSNAEIDLALADPRKASRAAMGSLQRAVGNRAVNRLIQAKLKVGPAGDQYEQEADRVAAQVVSQPDTQTKPQTQRAPEEDESLGAFAAGTSGVQRHANNTKEEELQAKRLPITSVQRHANNTKEEELQAKRLPTPIRIQRHPNHAEQEEIQRKLMDQAPQADADLQRASSLEGGEVGSAFENRLAGGSSGGARLPDSVRSSMESQIGADFSGVRIHQGSQAIQLNRDINAKAFTHGQNIYFGSGEYNPKSTSGKFLLAHELTHVAQQNPGAIQAYRGPIKRKAKSSGPIQVSPKRIQRGIGSWLKKKGSQALGVGRKIIQAGGALVGGTLGAAVGAGAGALLGGIVAALGGVVGAIAGAVGGAYTAGKAGANYGNNIVSKIFFGLLGGIGGAVGGAVMGGVAGTIAGAGAGVAATVGGAAAGAAFGGGHGFERADVKNFTSRKKRQDKLSEKYGTKIGDDKNRFTHGSLDTLDEVLSGLPRSHTKGNDKIKQIAEQRNSPDLPIAGASSYGNGSLNIVREIPVINVQIPSAVYSSMQKGPWRGLMDKIATMPFFKKKGARAQLNKSEDKFLGLGERSLFGKDVAMNKEDLTRWTIRHELGHAVDDQIKFTQKRARLTQFGGWKQYTDGLDEPAMAFLKEGGISEEEAEHPIEKVVTRTRINEEATEEAQKPIKEKYANMSPVTNKDGERRREQRKREELDKARVRENYNETVQTKLIDIFRPLLSDSTSSAEEHTETVENKLTDAIGDPPTEENRNLKDKLMSGVRKAAKAMRIGQAAPYLLADGGPSINNRIYQLDHYGTWVSYLKEARNHLLSNYQFSSPKEWFAEAYAAYYNPGNKEARSKLNKETLAFFEENLGAPVSNKKEAQEKEDASNTQLKELDDIPGMDEKENELDKTLLELHEFQQTIAEMRKEVSKEDVDKPEQQPKEEEASGPKMLTKGNLKPGDILMLHGGSEGVMAGQALGNGIRALFKGFIFGFKEYSSAKYYDYGHAALYVGGGQIAHATGEGVKVGPLDSGSEYAVFRNHNTSLATESSNVGKKWSNKNLKYDAWKATFGGGMGSSVLGPLGRDQAEKMQKGEMPQGFYCSEFVIAVYQVAALELMKKGAKNVEMLNMHAQNTSPQRLIANLHEKANGDNPSWNYEGVHIG